MYCENDTGTDACAQHGELGRQRATAAKSLYDHYVLVFKWLLVANPHLEAPKNKLIPIVGLLGGF